MASRECTEFGKFLECPVCIERYSLRERVPKVLPCGHTFCNICLKHLIQDTARGNSLRCPKCKAPHHLADRNVNSFSNNHDLCGMLDYGCEECQRYASTNPCQHCHRMLCDVCRTSHEQQDIVFDKRPHEPSSHPEENKRTVVDIIDVPDMSYTPDTTMLRPSETPEHQRHLICNQTGSTTIKQSEAGPSTTITYQTHIASVS